MNVLVVSHNYPRFAGDPAGAFVARLAEAVAARGASVRVLTPRAGAAAPDNGPVPVDRFRYAPDTWARVGYSGDVSRILDPRTLLVLPAFAYAFRRAVRRAAAAHQADVIHAHWWIPAGWIAQTTSVPVVITCHGTDVRLMDRWWPLRRAGRRVLRQAAAVTTVSEFLAADVRALAGGRLTPAVVRMPVDTRHFGRGIHAAKAVPPRILFAGNLVAAKGVDILVRAVAMLRDRGVVCGLRVIGSGPERPALQRLASSLRLADIVEWRDAVNQTHMPEEYGASTVTVLPSRGRAEGLGLVLVEALLSGCAVVGTAVGGIREVVEHERTGLLARDGDPADLARQLERLVTDYALRHRLTEQGRALAEQLFSPERAAARMLEIYHDAARGHPQR